MARNHKSKHQGRLILQLSNKQVLLAINGARWSQENSEENFTYRHMDAIRRREGFLLLSGAKLYALKGGWYIISGYGYSVKNAMPERFKVEHLRIDESDTLRTLGFAV